MGNSSNVTKKTVFAVVNFGSIFMSYKVANENFCNRNL